MDPHSIAQRDINDHEFRATLGQFATGLTVVAALDENGEPAGLTCQSFSALSLDPKLVLVCIRRASSSWWRIERTGRFAVSILAEDQRDISAILGSSRPDKFRAVPWHPSARGGVHVDGALATIDCQISTVYEAGDHQLIIGEVRDLAVGARGAPLLFFRGNYATALDTP
jgi:3-hydroxy-9,10-secoandrosta-1,3,5(10)-triene-9,17-dione monooxygenase reductase component